jgi:mannose-6-phosphate isomerase-like protein (cupin superfamily)
MNKLGTGSVPQPSGMVRLIGPDDAHVVPFFDGSAMAFLARGDDTSQLVSFWEFSMPPGTSGPPAHVHHGHDELFYVVSGELLVHTADGDVSAAARQLVIVPKGAQHTFSNPASEPMRMVGTFSPARFENYFDELAAELTKHEGRRPDPSVIASLYARYDTELA